jgi:hypothetical protein
MASGAAKKTIIILGSLTATALFGFVIAGDAIVQNRALLYTLLVVPIWGISSVELLYSRCTAQRSTPRASAPGGLGSPLERARQAVSDHLSGVIRDRCALYVHGRAHWSNSYDGGCHPGSYLRCGDV